MHYIVAYLEKWFIFEDTTLNVHLGTPSNVQRRTLSTVHLRTLQMYSSNQVVFCV